MSKKKSIYLEVYLPLLIGIVLTIVPFLLQFSLIDIFLNFSKQKLYLLLATGLICFAGSFIVAHRNQLPRPIGWAAIAALLGGLGLIFTSIAVGLKINKKHEPTNLPEELPPSKKCSACGFERLNDEQYCTQCRTPYI